MEYQCFAAAGFGVVYCNPRGSSGYGKVHQNIVRSTDGSAYYDCLQFVEEAARRFPSIDTERMGLPGAATGGYMVNYMAAHSSRFKAYITPEKRGQRPDFYASSDMQGSSKAYQSFEEFMVNSLKSSAGSYAEKIDRPFLILPRHGGLSDSCRRGSSALCGDKGSPSGSSGENGAVSSYRSRSAADTGASENLL